VAVEPLPTPSAPAAVGPYSPAVRAGDWVILSGQLGLDPATGRLVEGVEAQARQALANVAAVLGDCGAALTDVAKSLVFVTDLGDFATVNAVYADVFGSHRPARSTVQVAALPAGGQVEVEVWAYCPTSKVSGG
jgi:2-iminobutanoate/2-iminopropanoate deaminase